MHSIEGTLYLNSPLHIADASRGDDRIKSGSSDMTISRTQTLSVRVRDDENETASVERVPVIPANSLRGRLRRAAADLVFAALRDSGESVPIGTYHTICAGTADGRPAKSTQIDLNALSAFNEHPFIGLFGGGPTLVESRLVTDTAWGLLSTTGKAVDVPVSCRDELIDLRRGEYFARPIETVYFRRIDDVLQFSDPEAQDRITDYAEAAQAWLDTQRKRVPDDKSSSDKSSSHVQAWNVLECVMAGMPFSFRMEALETASDEQAGLLLRALERFVTRSPRLGGWTAKGFGRYDLSGLHYIRDGEDTGPLFARNGKGGLALNPDNAAVMEVAGAWDRFVADGGVRAADFQEWASAS